MSAPVILADHDPTFAVIAREEEARWKAACGTVLVDFHHIGSTAVPALIAKPVLDIMPVFTSLEALDALRDRIIALGVEWKGPYGLPGRRYCKQAGSNPIHHIHCYADGHEDITRHLAFRDYLRAHPATAAEYATIKRDCAARHPQDRHAYGTCKSAWIKATEAKALTWYQQKVAS